MSKKSTPQRRATQRRKKWQAEKRAKLRAAEEKLARKNFYSDRNLANLSQVFDIIEMDGETVLLKRG